MPRKITVSCILSALFLISVSASGLCANMRIGGYWENWAAAINPGSGGTSDPSYYANDLQYFNLVYYSFLTLAQTPNPDNPPVAQWSGQAIYESMTAADVITVMTVTDPSWENPYEWQRTKIQAIIDECHANGKKFIWAIGGWSDLTQTISDEQIPAFVTKCVNLLKLSGDGIDFDWEHLSADASIAAQQRRVLGKVLPALRQALDENGLSGKLLGYTTRMNAFWNNATRPQGVTAYDSDGEGIDVGAAMTEAGSSFNDCVDWVNIMMYDIPPGDMGYPSGYTLGAYTMVLGFFQQYMNKNKVVMGFEPGGQAAGGVWEGMVVDKEVIDYVAAQGYGGIMFWAINQGALSPSTEITGANAQELAKYASELTPVVTGVLPPAVLTLLLLDS